MSGQTDEQQRQELYLAVGKALVLECERHGVTRPVFERLISRYGRDTVKEIATWIKNDLNLMQAQKPRTDFCPVPLTDLHGSVVIPNMTAIELVALVKKRCRIDIFAKAVEQWDFWTDTSGQAISGRGKIFDVLIWEPGHYVHSDEVRKHFREQGYIGHVGALFAWFAQNRYEGVYATIPEDGACWRSSTGGLCAPHILFELGARSEVGCEETITTKHGGWPSNWCFVGFREVVHPGPDPSNKT